MKKLSNDGWAGVAAGLIMGLVGSVSSFPAIYQAVIIGAGMAAILISIVYLTEDAEEPEGLEIEKKVD